MRLKESVASHIRILLALRGQALLAGRSFQI